MVRVGRFNIKWMDIDMPELELVKLISHFAQSNKAEAKSPKTISWYTEMLTDYVKFLKATGRDTILAKLNSEIVREFIISEQGRKLSPYTVQGKARALKAFSSWLFAEGYTSDNLLANIKLPKAPVKIIEPLTTTKLTP